jgi:hypothetical protein
MGTTRRSRRPALPPPDEFDRAPAEREINLLLPGTSPAKARQFVHVRNGLLVALLADSRTRDLLAKWRSEAAGQTSSEQFAARIASECRTFVVETLGLPRPWLAYALLEVFWRALETGDWAPIAYEVDLMAPRMSLHWRTKSGESIDEASARLAGLHHQAQRALRRARTDWRGSERMKSSAEALMRAGYFWYLVNVSKIPKATIAREMLTGPRDARRTVQLEIAKAQRLIDEIPLSIFRG